MKTLWQLLFVCHLIMVAIAYPPYDSWSVYKAFQRNTCTDDNDVKALCQRCTILTKAENVYGMCCTNADEVQSWCNRVIEFGYQP